MKFLINRHLHRNKRQIKKKIGKVLTTILLHNDNESFDKLTNSVSHIIDAPKAFVRANLRKALTNGIRNGYLVKDGENYALYGRKSVYHIDSGSNGGRNDEGRCKGMRLEDLTQCSRQRVVESKLPYCHLHRNLHYLLGYRLKCIHEETWRERYITDDAYNAFKDFANEHFNKIFPTEPPYETECNISDDIWLNRNDEIQPPVGTCPALNLSNGRACGDIVAWHYNYSHCRSHSLLKTLHSDLYHVTFSHKYPAYEKVYNGSKFQNEGIRFARHYLEFFLRLQHLTIYQMTAGPDHTEYVTNLLEEIRDSGLLPDVATFYRDLYMKFCPLRERYVNIYFLQISK